MRNLLQEKNFFTDEETKKFDTFALSLDAAVVSRYHVILQDLKVLYLASPWVRGAYVECFTSVLSVFV